MTGEEFTFKMTEMGFVVTQLEPERGANGYIAVKKHLSAEAAAALMETVTDACKTSVQAYKELAAQSDAEVIEEENKAFYYADGWYKSISVVENTVMVVFVNEYFAELLEESFVAWMLEEGFTVSKYNAMDEGEICQ